MFSAQPQPTTRSASPISSAASGEANPPETSERPRVAGEQALGDGGGGEQRPARGRPAAPAPRGTRPPGAPRPATNTGRSRRRAAASASSSTAASAGRGRPRHGRPRGRCARVGRQRLHVQRQVEHARCAAARPPSRRPRPRRRTAEAARVHPLGHRADRGGQRVLVDVEVRPDGGVASAARTTSGVRLFAASVMPVIALVSPQPWCTVSTAGHARSSGRRRRPSSPRRPRAGPRRTGPRAATSALVTWKLPLPTTPKTVLDAEPASAAADHLGDGRVPRTRHRSTSASTRPGCPEPADDRQRPGDQRPRRWRGSRARFCSWVRPYLPRAEQQRVAGERRVEGVRRAGVGADGLDAEPDHRRLLGQPARAARRRCPACAGRSRRR